jgi:hypothetical protein
MLQQFLAQAPDQGIIVYQQNGGRALFGHG